MSGEDLGGRLLKEVEVVGVDEVCDHLNASRVTNMMCSNNKLTVSRSSIHCGFFNMVPHLQT